MKINAKKELLQTLRLDGISPKEIMCAGVKFCMQENDTIYTEDVKELLSFLDRDYSIEEIDGVILLTGDRYYTRDKYFEEGSYYWELYCKPSKDDLMKFYSKKQQ